MPTLRFDETLYSWCARTYLLNGPVGTRIFNRQLFGTDCTALMQDLPCYVDQILERVSGLDGSAIELARDHSVLGFYLPWLVEDKAELISRHVRGNAIQSLQLHLGLPASVRTTLHPLKGCLRCLNSDRAVTGIGYWHTEHQSPAAWVCTRHDEPLSIFRLPRTRTHYREWFLPDLQLKYEVISARDSAGRDTLRRLALFAVELRHLEASSLRADRLAATYREALRKQDLATRGGSLRIQGIVSRVRRDLFGLRHIPGFNMLDTISDEWAGFIGNVARKRSRPSHPLKHLMLIALLFERWDDFSTAYASAEFEVNEVPDTDEDDLVARQRSRRVAIFCDLVRSQKLSLSAAGRQVGVSATTAVEWAKQNKVLYTSRTQTLNADVIKRCCTMLCHGKSKIDVAMKYDVSMATLTRLLSSETDLRRDWLAAIATARRDRNRREFSALITQHPGVPIKLLRRLPGNGYTWLYRHDREWLIENLPVLRRRSSE